MGAGRQKQGCGGIAQADDWRPAWGGVAVPKARCWRFWAEAGLALTRLITGTGWGPF